MRLSDIDRDDAIAEALDGLHGTTRAAFLRRAALGARRCWPPPPRPPSAALGRRDEAILNYALTLEYVQDSFYSEVERIGSLTGELAEQARVVGAHERAHVKSLREVLGSRAVKRPRFDFRGATEDADALPQDRGRLRGPRGRRLQGPGPADPEPRVSRPGAGNPLRRGAPRRVDPPAGGHHARRGRVRRAPLEAPTLAIVADTHFVVRDPQSRASRSSRGEARTRATEPSPRCALCRRRGDPARRGAARRRRLAGAAAVLLVAGSSPGRPSPRRGRRSSRSPSRTPRDAEGGVRDRRAGQARAPRDETTWAAVRRDVVARARPSRSAPRPSASCSRARRRRRRTSSCRSPAGAPRGDLWVRVRLPGAAQRDDGLGAALRARRHTGRCARGVVVDLARAAPDAPARRSRGHARAGRRRHAGRADAARRVRHPQPADALSRARSTGRSRSARARARRR